MQRNYFWYDPSYRYSVFHSNKANGCIPFTVNLKPNILSSEKFCIYWLLFFGIILVRYFLIAGGAYWFFYSSTGKPFAKRLVQQTLRLKPARWKSIRQDIKLSVLSAVFFAICAAIVLSAYDSGVTLLYTSARAYGWWYPGVSFAIVLVLQDLYFYIIHRTLHHPLLFRWLHYGHHQSGEPTPWTSFSFDIPEAILQGLFFVGIVFLVPLHFMTMLALLTAMTLLAVLTHLGFELLPASFLRHWLGKWLISATYHSAHHHRYRIHYGLYFTFWDRLCGTYDPSYTSERAFLKDKENANESAIATELSEIAEQ
jgi:sterol desaturase/sphingolipid hydroxylase (fatty acid hydroxylase superfamily)